MVKNYGLFVCSTYMAIELLLHPCEGRTIDEVIQEASKSRFSPNDASAVQTSDAEVLVELDMRLTRRQWKIMSEHSSYSDGEEQRKKRKAMRPIYYRWENAQVFYRIQHHSFSMDHVAAIHDAIAEWEKFTCLRFIPNNWQSDDYIEFVDGLGCASHVGVWGGRQIIELADGCRSKGTIVHEIGHAIGFFHEQSRPDRDNYVTVKAPNIKLGYRDNFLKLDRSILDTYGVPYDYLSVMHYGKNFFTKNGQPTLVTNDPAYQNAIGNREGMSLRDVQLANLMYNCHLCAMDEYMCESYQCIAAQKLCDGHKDCYSGDDELHCQNSCGADELDCYGDSRQCVSKSKICDSVPDCGNGRDETFNCRCLKEEFDCGNSQCVPRLARCDGRADCMNNADEADCPADHCESQPCEHKCINQKHGFRCKCYWPFKVKWLQRTKCVLESDEASLIYGTPAYTEKLGMKSRRLSGKVTGIGRLRKLASDAYAKVVILVQNNQIMYYSTQGSNRTIRPLVNSDVGAIQSVSIDFLSALVFWTDSSRGTIETAHVWSGRRAVIISRLPLPVSIAVVPKHGLIYWSDHSTSTIEGAAMDGSLRRVVMSPDVVYKPDSLGVDHIHNRLYWVENSLGVIMSCDFDGHHLRTMKIPLMNRYSVVSIVPYNSELYITDSNKIYHTTPSNMLLGNVDTVLTSQEPIVGMVVHHRAGQIKGQAGNVCSKQTCEHVCVTVPRGRFTEARCLCPDGKMLHSDRRTCT